MAADYSRLFRCPLLLECRNQKIQCFVFRCSQCTAHPIQKTPFGRVNHAWRQLIKICIRYMMGKINGEGWTTLRAYMQSQLGLLIQQRYWRAE